LTVGRCGVLWGKVVDEGDEVARCRHPLRAPLAFTGSSLSTTPFLTANYENDWSTGSLAPDKSPWSVYGRGGDQRMKRPNPRIATGHIASLLGGVAMDILTGGAEGKIDAYLGFPPDPQELQAKQVGHVVVNSTLDRPWSHYFCCMVVGNRDFVLKHPVATKRALRAILKATDICGREPEQVARLLVDRGYIQHHDYALQALKEIPYGKWREYNPEDTVRFYALRLHEAGMIKSSPQKIIAEGTDWRFLNELKAELKG